MFPQDVYLSTIVNGGNESASTTVNPEVGMNFV